MSMSWKLNSGAIPDEQGCFFRVWAPNASEVYVVGSFNGFSDDSTPMKRDKTGYWSTRVEGVKPGDQYLYRIVAESGEFRRLDPYSRAANHATGQSLVPNVPFDWGKAEFQSPALNQMVVYELHLGTFSKAPGDDVGTIEEAMSKLDYLSELGINAVEIMPIMEFPGTYSWGYNPALIFAIESNYGAAHDLRRFIRAAHERGIAVFLDVVYNHFGPGDLDLWQFDGWHQNGKGGIYFYNDHRSHTPWGETRPDYGRPEVREYIRDNALYWLLEYHFDGLRWDATAFVRTVNGNGGDGASELSDGWSLMQWVNEEMRKMKPGAISIAEDLQNNPALSRPSEDGGAGFNAQWDAMFVHPVRQALIGADDASRDMESVRNAIMHRLDGDAFNRVLYTESHDEVANGKARVPEEVDPGKASSWAAKKKSALGAALVFTAPGVPMIFQGQEFLEDDWFHDKDPLDWSKKERFAGIWRLYRDLIALRLNRSQCTAGLCGQEVDVYHIDHENKILAFHRWAEGGPCDSVVVVVNFANQLHEGYELVFPAEGQWVVRFNGDSKLYDSDFGDNGGTGCTAMRQENGFVMGNLTIAPYSALILSQDE